jgi:hypothetical protein
VTLQNENITMKYHNYLHVNHSGCLIRHFHLRFDRDPLLSAEIMNKKKVVDVTYAIMH